MFNIFKSNKEQNLKDTPQEKADLSKNASNDELDKTKKNPVHGTNGVCCGGCGGE